MSPKNGVDYLIEFPEMSQNLPAKNDRFVAGFVFTDLILRPDSFPTSPSFSFLPPSSSFFPCNLW